KTNTEQQRRNLIRVMNERELKKLAYETISNEKRNKGVAWLTIDNAPANGIDEGLMSELESASEELANDEEVRVVVLASNHEQTCVAGLALKKAMQPGPDGDDDENAI